MSYKTITPAEYAERAARGEGVRLIDVREEWEHELTRVAPERGKTFTLKSIWAAPR